MVLHFYSSQKENSPSHEFDPVGRADGLAVDKLRPLRGRDHLASDEVDGVVGLGDELSADEASVAHDHAGQELKLVFP